LNRPPRNLDHLVPERVRPHQKGLITVVIQGRVVLHQPLVVDNDLWTLSANALNKWPALSLVYAVKLPSGIHRPTVIGFQHPDALAPRSRKRKASEKPNRCDGLEVFWTRT